MSGSGYDFNAISFSPAGRLFQVEYANKAVDKDGLSLAVRCSDGVLLAMEKNLETSLLAAASNSRIFWITNEITMAAVGYRPDSFILAKKAREETILYRELFNCEITVPELVNRLVGHYEICHLISGRRPFGCTCIFGSLEGPYLYAIEPSGTYYAYHACAFGRSSRIARGELENHNWKEMSCKEAVPIVSRIIQALHDKQKKIWNIELLWVSQENGGIPQKVPDELIPIDTEV